VISTFPYIVPPDLTIRQAAAASSQTFMFIGTLVLLPSFSPTPPSPIGCSAARSPRARRITDLDALAHPPAACQRARRQKSANAAQAFPPVELALESQAPEPGL
jgi:hypothetical protein